MENYQSEPIPMTMRAWTDSTKTVQVNLESLTLEVLLIRVSSDQVIYCISDQDITKTGNMANLTIPSSITQSLQPGEYKLQLSDITAISIPKIGLSQKIFTLLKSYKKCM